MTEIITVMDVLKRLTGALLLLKLAEHVIPKLVSNGHTTAEHAGVILGQIPALRADIQHEVDSAKTAMEAIQDRVEVIAQFLLLHKGGLNPVQSGELQHLLDEVRGA